MRSIVLFRTLVLTAVLVPVAAAKVWTVDNNPGNRAADFTSLQAANNSSSVQHGDTLYVAGSPISYGDVSFTKRLTIIGPGFFLTENTGRQASFESAKTGNIAFNTGSDSSLIMGMQMTGLTVNRNWVTVKRNLIRSTRVNLVDIPCCQGSTVSNVTLTQNYIFNEQTSSGYTAVNIVNWNQTNIVIANNYIGVNATTANASTALKSPAGSEIYVMNNVFRGKIDLQGAGSFTNNIHTDGTFAFPSGSVGNNIGNSTQFGSTGGNQENVDMATVFEMTGSTDAQWMLKSGSPAIGAGGSGQDAGMYGGSTPYVLSGVPPIPAVYEFVAPVTGSSSLPVSIKARSNN